MKTVKRTYYSKKENAYVTKIYTYNKKYSRAPKISKALTKSGAISKRFVNKTMKELGFDKAKYATQMRLEAAVEHLRAYYKEESQAKNEKFDIGEANKKITMDRVIATFKHDRLRGMLSNTGLSVEEIAKLANTTEDVLLNESNWVFGDTESVFTNEKGESYRFQILYNDTCMVKI